VTVDRTGWPPGPWDNEPDTLVWIDDATGLPCLVRRSYLGALCGYVGIPKGHPAFGKGYDDVDVEVHGGLTFADELKNSREEYPDLVDDLWLLGFDCAHLYDLVPGMQQFKNARHTHDFYRDMDYVRGEIARLAQQLYVLGETVND
jgi:hypothetical protein